MVLVSPEMMPTVCWVFEAEIVLLFHATSCRRGVQVTVHVGNVRQTAILEHIHGKVRLSSSFLGLSIFFLFFLISGWSSIEILFAPPDVMLANLSLVTTLQDC